MIKLITLLFTITVANANIFPFLLPDEGSHLNHHLQQIFKNSQNEIVIVTSAMKYPSLNKSIMHSLSHGVHLSLIVTHPTGDPLHLIAYQGVNLYKYTPRPLGDTLILVDNSHVCHLSGGLNEAAMGSNLSTAWCSDDNALVLRTQQHIKTLLKRSSTYLQ